MRAERDGCQLRLDTRALKLGYRFGSDALRQVGVVVERSERTSDRFEVRCYVLHLELAGVTRELVMAAP